MEMCYCSYFHLVLDSPVNVEATSNLQLSVWPIAKVLITLANHDWAVSVHKTPYRGSHKNCLLAFTPTLSDAQGDGGKYTQQVWK